MSETHDLKTPLAQFAYDLHQEVLAKCCDDADPLLREEAFTEVALELLNEHNETDSAELCYWHAKGTSKMPAAKLNAWSLSGDGATLDLFVVFYAGEGTSTPVPKSEMEAHYKLARGFLRRALHGFHTQVEESNPVFQAMRSIHEARENLTTVRLFFLTDGVVKSADISQEQIPGFELRYVFWDLTKLSRLRVGDRQVIELNFAKDYGGAVPALLAADATGEYRTFLAFLPAPILARIYGEHGQRLLERNVRAFLQAKNKVNRGLQKTLREEPHRFLAYNNGLCCTAAEVDVQPGNEGQVRLVKVRDFQIVNGGQTTASIYHALKKERTDITRVMVQVKLTVLTDPARVMEIVPLISRFANSQNKVNTADFSANGPYHNELEKLSRIMWAPPRSGLESGTQWYYERARGSYMDDKARQGTPARIKKWAAERPPEQKFTKTDVAKFEHMWACWPHLVCRGAEKNFLEFAQRQDNDGTPLVNGGYFQHLVAKAILWKTAEKLFSTLDLPQYRAQSVAYTLSWLAMKSNHRLDLNRIWQEQRVPSGLCDAITTVLSKAHRHLLHSILSGNPGEAAKKEECWKEFRVLPISLTRTWESEFAPSPLIAPRHENELLPVEWERLRQGFINDPRTIEALEAYTGRSWIRTRRRDAVSSYAVLSWDELNGMSGLGTKKARDLLEMFASAAE